MKALAGSRSSGMMVGLIALGLVLVSGCQQREALGGDAGVSAQPDSGGVDPPCFQRPLWIDKEVDLLFVIDNSNSMEQEQKLLRKNFASFIDALKTPKLGNKIPNIRIGVVSTDLGVGTYNLPSCETQGGDKGKLWNKPQVAGCTPPKDPWIAYSDGTTNVPGTGDPVARVRDAFSCIAEIGLNGCAFEQPMESARRALDPSAGPVNPGFLRNDPRTGRDALLAVVFITDEDDCSVSNTALFDPSQAGLNDPLGPLTSFRCFEFGVACECPSGACTRWTVGPRKNCVPGGSYLHKVDNYIKFFKNIKKTVDGKANPDRVVMAAIAGPTDRVEVALEGGNPTLKPSCQAAGGHAVPAVRIEALVHAFARPLTAQEKADIQAKRSSQRYWVDKDGTWREENFTTICTSDYTPALKQIGDRIVGTLLTSCIKPPALTDDGALLCKKGDVIHEDAAGSKVVCNEGCLDRANFTVQEITSVGRQAIRKCPQDMFDQTKHPDAKQCGQDCPCWRVVTDQVCSQLKGSSPYAVEIMRRTPAPQGTYLAVCAPAASYAWGTEDLAKLPQCKAGVP